MKKIFCSFVLSLCVSSGYASTINFDNLIEPGNYGPSTGSGFVDSGFVFSENMDAIDVSDTGGWWSNGVGTGHSGKFAAINNYLGDMLMSAQSGKTFSVESLWLNGWQGDDVDATISGFLNGNLIQSLNVSFSNPWQKFELNFMGIDSLVISGGNFLVDDIAIKDEVAKVAEPSSLMLMGLALMGIGLLRKKPI